MNGTGVSGRAKRRDLSQRPVTCCTGLGEMIYIYIYICGMVTKHCMVNAWMCRKYVDDGNLHGPFHSWQ